MPSANVLAVMRGLPLKKVETTIWIARAKMAKQFDAGNEGRDCVWELWGHGTDFVPIRSKS
ncbi:hypothetical protein AC579_8921 [Pseudocercospora musae]|uniref:Uncharacterized protein n=1 Tax=Pseudocercospora musae TaxID=113226 RepID=A0A139I0I6_9PEZI|nr:hypothetical protein AC579_8921 [Pseudocercospora musae]